MSARPLMLAALLLLVPLTGCIGGEDDPVPPQEEPVDQLEDWDVYYVQSTDDLPLCGSDTMGRLYYISDVSGFQVCTNLGWAFIDLTGPAGPPGVNGTGERPRWNERPQWNERREWPQWDERCEWPQWDERCERDRRIHGAGFDDSDSIQCIHLRDLEWWDPGRSRSRSRPEWDARCLRGATNLLHLQRRGRTAQMVLKGCLG